MIKPDGGPSWFPRIPGDPGAVRDASGRLGRLAAQLGAQGSIVTREASLLSGDGWTGSAADRFGGLAHRLAGLHADVESCLGSLPAVLSAYADALDAAQQQLSRAEQMMVEAEDDYAAGLSVVPVLPADPAAAAAQHHQATLRSLADAFDERRRTAAHLAQSAMSDHQAAVARLNAHVTRVADEAAGVQGTLTSIGDALGVPVAVLSALSTVAMLRAAERLATVGSAFAVTAGREGADLAQFLGRALARGDMTVDEAMGRIVSFVDHRELAGQLFANEAKADAGAGGLLDLGRFTGAAKWAGRGAGLLAMVGDTYTIWHPDEGGAWGNVERGVAAVNGAGTAGLLAVDGFELAGAGGVLAADATLGWVPVAGQVVVIGSGLYLMGNYLYTHAQWFHDGVDAVGEGFADAGEAIGHGALATGEAIADGTGAAVHAVGSGLNTAGRDLASAAGSVAGFFGL